jgi:hypothetical protein
MLSSAALLPAQMAPKLTVSEPNAITLKKGGTAELKLTATLTPGFHANSHTPNDETLIPLALSWEPGPLIAKDVVYPPGKLEKYEFADKPLSVVAGQFDVATKFTTSPDAKPGPATMTGKLHYQACSNNACFPPKTVPVHVAVIVQ